MVAARLAASSLAQDHRTDPTSYTGSSRRYELLTRVPGGVGDRGAGVFDVLVGRIRRRENVSERKPDARVGRDVMEGLRFVFDNRPLRGIVMSAGSADLLMGISSAMFIVLLATLPICRPCTESSKGA